MRANRTERGVASAVLFGRPFIEARGGTVECAPERRFQLLVYLSYHREWLTRDALAFLFWPDQDNARARGNLRWLLHSLRDLPAFEHIEAERDRVRMAAVTDVERFQQALRETRSRDALDVYRGPFCLDLEDHASEPFAKWLGLERSRLSEQFHGAAIEVIDSSDASLALGVSARLLQLDRSDEAALRGRLRALRKLDRADQARHEYRVFCERLADELGLEPGAETRALMRELEASVSPSGRAVPSPMGLTSFVGRASELVQIQALLAQSQCRLLTLLGPGGIGKSRLARQVVAAMIDEASWIVPLEGLALPSEMAAHVARAVGIVPSAEQDAVSQVELYFSDRAGLLLLDNFEQVIDAADVLARWLAACPKLRLIVTSRERLDVSGECLLPVEGLEFPRSGDIDAQSHDAVRLFCDRAAAATPGFDGAAERTWIAEIVRRVEGMPLAIELVAPWTRILSCADIAHDLARSFELLERDETGRPEHRSARASFEHSWSLLVMRERSVLAQLSVFSGGFGREALRHVTDGPLTTITQLIDKSLVRVDAAGRFSLHPVVKEFAAAKLTQADDALVRARHAEFFAHWLQNLPGSGNVDQKASFAELDIEIDNCLSAWRWAIEHRRADLVQASIRPLQTYFEYRCLLREGLACFDEAEALDAAIVGQAPLGYVARAKATLLLRLGRYEEAERGARRALQSFRLARDSDGIKGALATLGLANWERARYAQARPYFAEGLKRSRADGDRRGEATFLMNLALISKAEGRLDDVESMLPQAIAICREIGNIDGCISGLNNLSNVYRALKQPARGRAPLLEALALCEDSGGRIALPFVLVNLALVELELGRLDAAREYASRALPIVRDGAESQIEIGCLATLARIDLAAGAPAAARVHLRAAAILALKTRHVPHMLGIAVHAAAARRLEGDSEAAAAILYHVRSHPSAAQLERDDADRELALLAPLLPHDADAAAQQRSIELSLDTVIAEAIGAAAP